MARALRRRFEDEGVLVVSLVSSPGAGKTAFLQETLTQLRKNYSVAALVGDLATENDAKRLKRSGVPIRQITTGTVCHLEAAMVAAALSDWQTEGLGFSLHRKRWQSCLPRDPTILARRCAWCSSR